MALPALANGRFPQAQQLIEDPNDPDRLVLRATFGIVYTENRGQNWNIICENVVGYSGTEDPSMGIMQSGRIVAGIFAGLASTADDGCTWEFAPGGLKDRFVVDLTVDKNDPTKAISMVSMGIGPGKFLNQNYETTDSGATWAQLGPDINPKFLGLTIDPAPSDPTRIYMSGFEPGVLGVAKAAVPVPVPSTIPGSFNGVLLRSNDRGASFRTIDIPGADSKSAPFIAAVHPTNPDVLFVRTSGVKETDGGRAANDALLYSDDAGDTWTEVIRGPAKMLGFALSPDGSEVLIGFGDPRDGTQVDPAQLGIWKSPVPGFSFEKIFPGNINCLLWSPSGVFACTAQFVHGYELGFAPDASFTLADTDFQDDKISTGGKSALSPLMVLNQIDNVVQCPAGTPAQEMCPQTWPSTCELLGKCEPDAGFGGSGFGGSGSGGASGGAGGASDDDGDGGSCGCRAPGEPRAGSYGAAAALAFAVWYARRRRRR